MSATVTITCPKCGNKIQMVPQDTKIVYAYTSCSVCNEIFKVS